MMKKNFKYYFSSILLFAAIFVWYAVYSEGKNVLTVAFLDVGQGDAIFIEAPGGNQVLIDGGKGGKVLSEISSVMPFYDRSIDAIIATHPDVDHIGGLPDVLNNFDVGAIFISGSKSDSATSKEFGRLSESENAKIIPARRGQIINLGGGAYLEILFPIRDTATMESNTSSIVAKLTYGETSFLFTGDSPIAVENYLASAYSEALNVDVLKVGHHGSRTSSSERFVGYASPDYAIISAGKNNSYGHPHKEVLDIFEKFGVKILATYEIGAIIMKSDGKKIFSLVK